MKKRLNKYTCDRCGKSDFFDTLEAEGNKYSFVTFDCEYKVVKGGHVCPKCNEDFIELAKNFFDEVNKDEQH